MGETEENRLLRAKIDRIDAKIAALLPLGERGDDESKAEILNLRAMRTATCEEITNSKKPAEQVRILTHALSAKQKTLDIVNAEVDLCKAELEK